MTCGILFLNNPTLIQSIPHPHILLFFAVISGHVTRLVLYDWSKNVDNNLISCTVKICYCTLFHRRYACSECYLYKSNISIFCSDNRESVLELNTVQQKCTFHIFIQSFYISSSNHSPHIHPGISNI